MRRRWIAVAVVVVVLAVVVGVVANTRRGASVGRAGSTALGAGQPITITTTPPAYSIEYRLEERVGGGVRVSTEKVLVRRPFDSATETWSGAPPGRTRLSRDIWTLGRSETQRPRADAAVSDQPPAVAAADVRIDASMSDALRAGVVQRRERRRVVGRVCQVLRSRERLVAIRLSPPTTRQYVDSCVDPNGVVLEELTINAGKRDVRRLAVKVDLRPSVSDDAFKVGQPNIDVKNGGGSTRAVDPATNPPGQFWQLDQPPAGFVLVGRFAVVPPQPENFTDPLREGFRRAGVSDVFGRGPDVLVVERGASLRGQPVWEVDPANAPVDLGPLGQGEVVLSGRGAEVRALTGGGRYVRVFGTLPPDDLAALARQLHLVPGGELRYLNP